MTESDLRALVLAVRTGDLSRRDVVLRLAGVGLGIAAIGAVLGTEADAAPRPPYAPVRAGGGGVLKLLWWQAPTLLNPHFAVGAKDQEASRIFYEPLATWNDEGQLVPVLAAAIPTRENGGLSADSRTVTWTLKPGIRWHDGQTVTAEDVAFTARYAADPATAATTAGPYRAIAVEVLDPLTVRVRFEKPTPFWAEAFVGALGLILPRHVFEPYAGARSREAPANLAPIGTGPYRFVDFRPGDMLRAERFADYHLPDRPFFDALEMKGGGDAVTAARAVLQTGDYDFASSIQVEDELLTRLEAGGHGRVDSVFGGNLEFILLNASDPETEIDGERSSVRTQHFAFSDPAVRRALSLVIDRQSLQDLLYGRTGRVSGNSVNGPAAFVSTATHAAYDPEAANRLLDEAGWRPGPDGVREKNGRRLAFVFQTTINGPRQKTQAIIKSAARRAGMDIEIKAVPATTFFSSDVNNRDTYSKFYVDMQMLTGIMIQPDPARWMLQYVSWEVASKANKWQGRNVCRWRSETFDDLYRRAEGELDPVRRAALFIAMNDLAVEHYVLPLLHRSKVSAIARTLVAPQSGWDNDLAFLPDWHRTG